MSASGEVEHHPLVIDLDELWDFCCVCDEETPTRQGIPMYEGRIVLIDDEIVPWGGFPACQGCFDLYQAGDYVELERLQRRATS